MPTSGAGGGSRGGPGKRTLGREGAWPGAPESCCPGGCGAFLFVHVVRWPPPCVLRQALGGRSGDPPPLPERPPLPTPPGLDRVHGTDWRRGRAAGQAAGPVWPTQRLQPRHLPWLTPSGVRVGARPGAPAGCAHPGETGPGTCSGQLQLLP